MSRLLRNAWLLCLCGLLAFPAQAALRPDQLLPLVSGDSEAKLAVINDLATSSEPQAERVLLALAAGDLFSANGALFLRADGQVRDAATGAPLTADPEGAENVVLNNRVRSALATVLAGMRLFAPGRDTRLAAARELQAGAGPLLLPLLDKALAAEQDAEVRAWLGLAQARARLQSPDAAQRLSAVTVLGEHDGTAVKTLLLGVLETREGAPLEADAAVRAAAKRSLSAVEQRLALAEHVARVFTGVSLGSLLLLAALGLAITYGVMGVINMAHGEFLMIGAYSAYLSQSLMRAYAPGWVDAYVLLAIPAAFLITALIGMALERLVIRRLYGRPLETLLATWGISLCLIQAARSVFGPQNVELANPGWMAGGIELLTGVVLPWNRIVIVAFSVGVLLLVWALLNGTRLGLHVRAVTQNRSMAGCVGVATGRVDTLAFGLGAGIAGLGGVALSQVSNVGPDMGQSYIVDSFMVVVLGGVGQLAGTVWAALGLGVVTKFLEGWTGAVIAKILVLVFIIIFIQKRPQGLFALKGRFADA